MRKKLNKIKNNLDMYRKYDLVTIGLFKDAIDHLINLSAFMDGLTVSDLGDVMNYQIKDNIHENKDKIISEVEDIMNRNNLNYKYEEPED